ncbi:L,D-transpeptidase family protein [Streptomyces bambusae]|uniref:L,D-transpeptidase family protein n=1 Tax=Streptomyces bambusae TaxID=1550616 RepID=UPI001D000207|nr:L,D-transpeptidase family protein [Streptomyces bambusae]MCB5169535.1 L,D-transpeptidase family protein [Streptomyces bambusae]
MRKVLPAVAAAALTWAAAVPGTAAAASGSAAGPPCTADTGPYQWELEQYLGLPADGRQDPADCAAIRGFQERAGVRPADGYAGLATHRTSLVVAERARPNRDGRCPVRSGRTVCVDLTRQLLWVQRDGRPVYEAVPVRTGRWGQETREGRHEITERIIDETSQLYDDAPMPYAQYFSGGQAFHGVYGDLFNGGGSAGCINMQLKDAERLWDTTRLGDAVVVWGRKPGT